MSSLDQIFRNLSIEDIQELLEIQRDLSRQHHSFISKDVLQLLRHTGQAFSLEHLIVHLDFCVLKRSVSRELYKLKRAALIDSRPQPLAIFSNEQPLVVDQHGIASWEMVKQGGGLSKGWLCRTEDGIAKCWTRTSVPGLAKHLRLRTEPKKKFIVGQGSYPEEYKVSYTCEGTKNLLPGSSPLVNKKMYRAVQPINVQLKSGELRKVSNAFDTGSIAATSERFGICLEAAITEGRRIPDATRGYLLSEALGMDRSFVEGFIKLPATNRLCTELPDFVLVDSSGTVKAVGAVVIAWREKALSFFWDTCIKSGWKPLLYSGAMQTLVMDRKSQSTSYSVTGRRGTKNSTVTSTNGVYRRRIRKFDW